MKKISVKKLRFLFVLVLAILVFTLVIYIARYKRFDKSPEGYSNVDKKNGELYEILPNAPIDFSKLYVEKTRKYISSYVHPTEEEKEAIYNLYGFLNCEFTNEGLIIDKKVYDDSLYDKLITDEWPNRAIMNNVIKPDFGEIDLIEVHGNFVAIYMQDVKQNDANDYVKSVKSKFKNSSKKKSDSVLYYAMDDSFNEVLVKYDKSTRELSIEYKFTN